MKYAKGYLNYSIELDGYYKLILALDDGLADLYRSLIPKHLNAKKPRYPAHITVVRQEYPPNTITWGIYDGGERTFKYDPEVVIGDYYIWLRCWSRDLIDIRLDLGLPESSRLTRPPDGEDCFHLTVANRKG